MKKLFALVLTIALLGSFALAEGVTIKTVSTFAGTDAAADTYQQLLDQWAAETGNTVEDASATSDEAWKAGVINDFAAGNEPDILFYFARPRTRRAYSTGSCRSPRSTKRIRT